MIESKTSQALRLFGEGLSYPEIATRIGSTAGAVGVLLWQARHREARNSVRRGVQEGEPAKLRERRRRRNEARTPEERREEYYRRKCREAGVDPDQSCLPLSTSKHAPPAI